MVIAEASGRLVGRDPELAQLRLALEETRHGRGSLLMVFGEAGVGKTSLLEVMAERARSQGLAAHWGRCWEFGGSPAYWPWTQVLRSITAAGAADLSPHLGEGVREVAQLVPRGSGLPGPPATMRSDAPHVRARLFDAVGTFLATAAAARGGLLVLLDDLHAADEVSVRLLRHLADRVATSQLVVVGSAREDEARERPRVARQLEAAAAAGHVIPLGGLDQRQVADLLERVTGEHASADLARRVQQSTDGNPFFVLETARMLGTSGGTSASRQMHTGGPALLRSSLDVLEEGTRNLLRRAAVLGRDFELVALAATAGASAEAVLDELAGPIRLGLVRETTLGRFSFRHSLIAQSLYAQLDSDERAALHQRAGVALELSHPTELDAHAAALAHHFLESGADVDRAVRYADLAARQAMTTLAFEEAGALLSRAVQALDEARSDERGRRYGLLVGLGEARFRAGDFAGSREAYHRALRTARAMDSPERMAEAALGVAGLAEAGAGDERITVLEEALGALPDSDSPLRSRLLLSLAGARHRTRPDLHREGALRMSSDGLAMARRLGDPDTLRHALWQWHTNTLFLGCETLGERLAVATELVQRSADAGDHHLKVWGLEWRAVDLFEAGDMPEAIAAFDVALGEAQRLGEPFLIWGATYPRAAVALLQGRLDEAEAIAHQALAIGERFDFVHVEVMFGGQLAWIRRHQGRYRELEQLNDQRRARFPWLVDNDPGYPLLLVELGRLEEARRCYQAMHEAVVAGQRGQDVEFSRAVLADVCWLLADAGGARPLYDSLLPVAGRHLVNGVAGMSMGSADRYLAELAALLGRYDEADARFEAAHRMHRRMGARPWLAVGQEAQARMLLMRDRPGDRLGAAEAAHAARTTFSSLGMNLHARRVAATVRSIGPQVSPDTATMRHEGEEWVICYGDKTVRLRDSKGLRHLAVLLGRPGQDVAAIDLTGEDNRERERARQSVARALRAAMDRMADAHPLLGEHLQATVRAGASCSYTPDTRKPIVWRL